MIRPSPQLFAGQKPHVLKNTASSTRILPSGFLAVRHSRTGLECKKCILLVSFSKTMFKIVKMPALTLCFDFLYKYFMAGAAVLDFVTRRNTK